MIEIQDDSNIPPGRYKVITIGEHSDEEKRISLFAVIQSDSEPPPPGVKQNLPYAVKIPRAVAFLNGIDSYYGAKILRVNERGPWKAVFLESK